MNLPNKCEVIIIGGGVSGCSVAYHLSELGCENIILIERKKPLTVPPDFTSLPKPSDTSEVVEKEESNLDLKKVLNESQKVEEVKSSDNLEKSISDILNKR